jgi:rfaE bifunctional protein nucleotidyltransferase chain/domain
MRQNKLNINNKILSLDSLINKVSVIRKNNQTIVFTSGCFDILHIGHTRFLKKAATYGDVMILALNSDDSVNRVKGKTRPIINQSDRAELLSELIYLDYIVFLNHINACSLIDEIRPEFYVKGEDYRKMNEKLWPEADMVRSYSGEIKYVKLVPNRSTTSIINKIHQL